MAFAHILVLVSFTIEYKVGIAEFYLCMRFGADLLTKQCGHQSLKTAKIGICTSLKLEDYFWFVSQTILVEVTTSLSRMQKLVKIGKEL